MGDLGSIEGSGERPGCRTVPGGCDPGDRWRVRGGTAADLGGKVFGTYLHPLAVDLHFNLQLVRRQLDPGHLCFAGSVLTEGPAQSKLELWRLRHAAPGQLLVLQLGPLVPGLTAGARGAVDEPDTSLGAVLVLAARPSRGKGLQLAVSCRH